MRLLEKEQFLPIPLAQAWEFFCHPKNLNEITPPDMTFHITSQVPEVMYEGLLITYKVSPLLGIKLDWTTEITHIQEHVYFVDEQRFGPYKMWHHEHHFREAPGGVMMTDRLYYAIGWGPFGWLAGALFVHGKVRGIFEFRERKLKEMFGV